MDGRSAEMMNEQRSRLLWNSLLPAPGFSLSVIQQQFAHFPAFTATLITAARNYSTHTHTHTLEWVCQCKKTELEMTDEAGVRRGGRRGDGERRVKFEGVGIREQAPPPRSSSYDCTVTCDAICHSSSYSSIPDLQVSEGRLTSLFKQSQLLLLTLAKHTQFSLDSKPTGFFSFSLPFFAPPSSAACPSAAVTHGRTLDDFLISLISSSCPASFKQRDKTRSEAASQYGAVAVHVK